MIASQQPETQVLALVTFGEASTRREASPGAATRRELADADVQLVARVLEQAPATRLGTMQ